MNIWFVLWIVLSSTLIVFMVWSMVILFRQKKAWKGFAQKYSLRYQPGKIMQSPEMNGVIEDYKFSFLTSEYGVADQRTTRKMSAIEISLNSILPIEGGVANGGLIDILKNLNLKAEVSPTYEGWSKAYMAASSNKAAMELYLTPERLGILTKLMQIPNSWVIFIFRNDMCLLRLDTPNPLDSDEQLEKLHKLMLKAARILELKAGESALIKAEEAKAPIHERALEIAPGKIADASSLTLED